MIDKSIGISEALASLRPNNAFAVFDNQYETVEWFGPDKIPTLKEVEEEIERLKKEKENAQYQQKRAIAYPSIIDQLDILYHEGYDKWKKVIKEVKDRYPKP
jgi:hypothetical protein